MTPEERKAILEAVPDYWMPHDADRGPKPMVAHLRAVRRAVEARIRKLKTIAANNPYSIHWSADQKCYEQFADWLDGVDDPRKELE